MNAIRKVSALIAVILLAISLAPTALSAQTSSETVTVQVDVVTPAGTQIIGTIVADRQCGDTTLTTLRFNGMVNGQPASAAATGTERWSSNSSAQFDLTAVTDWNINLARPDSLTLTVAQLSTNLISVNGVPVAIDGDLMAPCGGKTSYTITNVGRGLGEIVLLPNTGDGSLMANPLVIVAFMVVPGIALVLVSSVLNRFGRRKAGQNVA